MNKTSVTIIKKVVKDNKKIMNLFILKAKYNPYQNRVQTVYPDHINKFIGISYREDEDFSEAINELKFRLQLDHNDRKNPNLEYIGTDFYDGPLFLETSEGHCLHFYTVSPKMKEVLSELNLPKHRFYPIKLIIDKGKEEAYYILQIDYNMTPYMDYTESVFYGENIITDEIIIYGKGEIKNEEEFFYLIDNDIIPNEKEMYINQELDWIYMAPYFMITEKAKKLFKDNNLIDLEITPFYELDSSYGNELGYLKEYAGREIIINGKSTMDGLDINDFPRKTE